MGKRVELGFCTSVSWASKMGFYYCRDTDYTDAGYKVTSGNNDQTSMCNLAPFDREGSGMGYFPRYGGDFCTWQSEVRKITSEEANTKHGIRGLNVMLRWKELGIKESSDFVEVELKACGNKEMTHHCTDWSRAHYHEDDLNPQPGHTCLRTFRWGWYTYCPSGVRTRPTTCPAGLGSTTRTLPTSTSTRSRPTRLAARLPSTSSTTRSASALTPTTTAGTASPTATPSTGST